MTVKIFCIKFSTKCQLFKNVQIHREDIYLYPDSFEKIGRRKITALIQSDNIGRLNFVQLSKIHSQPTNIHSHKHAQKTEGLRSKQ